MTPRDEFIKTTGPKEFCICAAIVTECGKVIRGHHHCHVIRTIKEMGLMPNGNSIMAQGFVTSTGRFVGRKEGLDLQIEAGIPSNCKEGYKVILFSDDLY